MPLEGNATGDDGALDAEAPQQEALDVDEKVASDVPPLCQSRVVLERQSEDIRLPTLAQEQMDTGMKWLGNQSDLEDASCESLEQKESLVNSSEWGVKGATGEEMEVGEAQMRQQNSWCRPKGSLDPLGSRRAALSVEILQNTLQDTEIEKDGLALCYAKLQGYYQSLGQESKRKAPGIQTKIAEFEPQGELSNDPHTEQMEVAGSRSNTRRSWTQRPTVSDFQCYQDEHRDVVLDCDRRSDVRTKSISFSHGASLAKDQLQRLVACTFSQWKHFAREGAERRQKPLHFAKERSKRMAQYAVSHLTSSGRRSRVQRARPVWYDTQKPGGKAQVVRAMALRRQEEGNHFPINQLDRELMKQIIRHWMEKAQSLQEAEEKSAWMHAHSDAVKLQHAIRRWHWTTQQGDGSQLLASSAIDCTNCFAVLRCMKTWRKAVIRAKEQGKLRSQRESFAQWSLAVSRRKAHAKSVATMRSNFQRQTLARSMTAWRECVVCCLHQRQLALRWLNRLRTRMLQNAWVRWQQQIVVIRHQCFLRQLQVEREAHVKRLEMGFEQYRESQLALLNQAERARMAQAYRLQETTELLREVQRREHHYAKAVDALCSSRGRAMVLRKCFRCWQFESLRSKRGYSTAEQLRIEAENRRKHGIFTAWSRWTARQSHLLSVSKMIASYFTNKLMVECFTSWKVAKQQGKVVRMCSALVAHNTEMSAYRRSYPEWRVSAKRVYFLGQIIGHLWLGSVHKTMQEQLSQWMEPVVSGDAKGQYVVHQAMLADIQAKLWSKWSLFLQRLFFLEWRHIVAYRVKRHLAQQKLRLLVVSRVSMRCFHAWVGFAERQAKLESRNRAFARWIQTFQRRRLEHGLSRWKTMVIRAQQFDLQEFKRLHNSHLDELCRERAVVAALQKSLADTGQNMMDVAALYRESQALVQVQKDRDLLLASFNNFKFQMIAGRHQIWKAQVFRKSVWRRRLISVLSGWRSVVWGCYKNSLIAVEKGKRNQKAVLRFTLQQWWSSAYYRRVLRQKESTLRQRISSRLKVRSFGGWRYIILREKDMRTTLLHLAETFRQHILKSRFLRWKELCLAQRQRYIQKREKRKQLVAMVVKRNALKLSNMFRSWQKFYQFKQHAHEQAQRRCNTKRRGVLLTVWEQWCASVEVIKDQSGSTVRLALIANKYYLRLALARWKETNIFRQIKILELEQFALLRQAEESRNQIQEAGILTDHLSKTLAEVQDNLAQAESRLSTLETQSAAEMIEQSKKLKRLRALTCVLVKSMVTKTAVQAFAQWKNQLTFTRSQRRALATVVRIVEKKACRFTFYRWKQKSEQQDRISTLQQRCKSSRIRLLVRRWKIFTIAQAKLKLVLTKRYLALKIGPGTSISFAFKVWKNIVARMAALQLVTTLSVKVQSEQNTSSILLSQLALGKLSWRAYHRRLQMMRRFFAQCYLASTQQKAAKHYQTVEDLKEANAIAIARAEKHSTVHAENQRALFASAEQSLTSASSFQALKTLVRRLFQSTTVKDLFGSVSGTFAQILHGSSATLFFFDPAHNELWTQREEGQVVQVPASLGIAGNTLSRVSTVLVADVRADPHFHPMVDQFVLRSLQQNGTSSACMLETTAQADSTPRPTISLLSSPIVSTDGSLYGVLQVAFITSELSSVELRVLTTQAQLYSNTCCFYVEQIIFEMLRNCRDQVRARSPDKFAKLFKQNKNWRKYYVAIERRASELEGKLHDVLEEREGLLQARKDLEKRHQHAREKLEVSQRNSKDMCKQAAQWKQQRNKWQQLVDAKDRDIEEKTLELEQLTKEFAQYRHEKRTKELQNVLNASSSHAHSGNRSLSRSQDLGWESGDQLAEEPMPLGNYNQLSLLRADKTKLKSQLVRAEADNLLLVKAIDMARSQLGELPAAIQAEVVRIAARVSSRSTSDA